MIYVIEGPNYSGKTTVSRALGKHMDLPIFTDLGRRRGNSLIPLEMPRDWVIQGLQSALDIAAFSNQFKFVVDRWVLTNIVYDDRRGYSWPAGSLREIISIAYAKVYLLNVRPLELINRSRNDREDLKTIDDANFLCSSYKMASKLFKAAGGFIVNIDGEKKPGDIVDEILRK